MRLSPTALPEQLELMVFIEDKGSRFKAPLDKIWKLLEAHDYEGDKIHPETRIELWRKSRKTSPF